MKIAVTGASGFIGKELLDALGKTENVDAVAISRAGTVFSSSEYGEAEWRNSDYTVESLAEVLADTDCVIHLAGVRGTENAPERFAVNETITESLLKASALCGVKRIVFASTVSVYDDEKLIPWREDAPLKGRTAYGDSKISCEKLIEEYSGKHSYTYGIARIAQVIGEGEKRRGMMNVFIDTAREHGTIKVLGKSVSKRQYIFINDLINILTILAIGNNHYKADNNTVLNVGMEKAYSNYDIAGIVNMVYKNPTPICYEDDYPESNRGFCMDVNKLKEELQYVPLDMEEAISELKEMHYDF